MPAVSAAQYRLMRLVQNDPQAAHRLGIPQSVGQEFVQATPNPSQLPKHVKPQGKPQKLAALLSKA